MTNPAAPESVALRRGQAVKARRAAALADARNKAVRGILAAHNLPTEQQFSDALDFTEVAVWTLRAMLDAAYEAGRIAGEAAR